MKTKISIWPVLIILQAVLVMPALAQWNQNTSPGPFNYTDAVNWSGGNISGIFQTNIYNGLTVQFPADYTFTNNNGIVLGYGSISNVIFQSSSSTAHTLKLSGNIVITNAQGATVTVGTTTNPLILDLNGATRNFGGGTPNGAVNSTMNIYAQIIDSSGNTNGVNLSQNRVFTYLLNTNNSFIGPVSFTSFRGGGFSSIKPVGAGASALGAPTDSTNGTITVTDGASNGSLKYSGSGDTSDRAFLWNLTFIGPVLANAYSLQNAGSGLLKLTGPQRMPTAVGAEFIINALNSSIEFDGYLNSTNGGNAYLEFTGSGSTNVITLNGPTNDFSQFELNGNVALAYNTISNAPSPCSLGTNGTIYIKNGNLQYIGTNAFATNNRTLYLAGSPAGWGIENASSNTLVVSSILCTNLSGTSTNLSGTTNGPAGARALNLNVLSATDAGPSGTLLVSSQITDASVSNSIQVVAGSPLTYAVFNGGIVGLLGTNNTFAGGVQIKYDRTLQVMSLADTNKACSIGLGTNLPGTFAPITFGSTDSQRGGILSYIGTNNVLSCNRQMAVLGSSGTGNSFQLLNNSPNNSSVHFSATAPVAFNAAAMDNCAITFGGAAAATNEFDLQITNTLVGNASVTMNGATNSAWVLTGNHTYAGNTTIINGTLALSNNGAIAKSPVLAISAGATFDISGLAASGFTLTGASPQQTLSGGSTSGTATISAPSKSVMLASSALLSFQAVGGGGSSLGKISVTGASSSLTLNNNTITVNISGSTLAAGTYRLLDCAGTLTGSANATPTLTGTALSAGYSATISTTTGAGGHVDLIVIKAIPTFSIASTLNPAAYLASVTFNATISTDATGLVVFTANGVPFSTNTVSSGVASSGTVTNLPRGTDVITGLYSGDTHYQPATNSLNEVITNHPPVVTAAMQVTRFAGLSVKIALADLATNWADADGDAVTLSGVNLTTTNSVTLMTNNAYILYPNGPNVADQFNYTIGDGQGGSATGVVNIMVVASASGQTQSIMVSGGTAVLSFAGVPGSTYNVDRSTNLISWTTIETTNAPGTGLFNYTDDFSDLGGPPSSAYYRLSWVP